MRRKRSDFWGHIDELRRTLVRLALTLLGGFIAAFFFHKPILSWLISPIEGELILLSPFEGFSVACKIAFVAGLLLTSPLSIYWILSFIVPGLYKRERGLIGPICLLSYLFISAGVVFAHSITLPFSLQFLHRFSLGTEMWALSKTLSFVLSLLFAHAFLFETVVIALFLTHIGILKRHHLIQARRTIYVTAFIIAAILTPPDVVSQILLALPLLLLFEGICLYATLRAPASLPDL